MFAEKNEKKLTINLPTSTRVKNEDISTNTFSSPNQHRRKAYGPNSWDTSVKQRAILKHGECNVLPPKFRNRYLYYIKDIFTSLVDAEWKWSFQVMCLGFTSSWLTFALLWWLIAFVHKDLHEEHLPQRQAEIGWTPCVLNIYGFHSCFLYSVESQSTIGYGVRSITEECPEAIFLLCAQCIIGMIIDTFTIGVIFAKLTRPRRTACTIQFSRNAVIAIRDDEYCLMMRIADIRKNLIVGVSVKAFIIHSTKTPEGEELLQYEKELEIECDQVGNEPIFLWPVTATHKINKKSPLFHLSAREMLDTEFEIILVLEGTKESTGQNIHAKTSYLNNEILWGQQFYNMVLYNKDMRSYEVDFKYFEKIRRTPMPVCSAAEYESLHKETSVESKKVESDHFEANHVKNRFSNINTTTIEKKFNIESRSSTPPFPIWL